MISALYPADATGLDFDDWTLDDRFAEMMFDEEKEFEEQKNFLKKMKEEGEQAPRKTSKAKFAKRIKKRPTAGYDQGPEDNKNTELAKKKREKKRRGR